MSTDVAGPRTAFILSIGDELVAGEILDTNAMAIAAELARRGVRTLGHGTLPDDRGRIAGALVDAAAVADLVVATGGLGPTADDLTRFALGDVVAPGADLVEDEASASRLRRWFKARASRTVATNLVQALRPSGARMLANEHGTADGLLVRHGGATIVCLPGPPREMRPMLEGTLDALVPAGGGLPSGAVLACGLPESEAADRLGDLMDRGRDPVVGTTAADGVVAARVRAIDADEAAVRRDLDAVERAWAPYAFGRDGATPATAAGAALRRAGETVVTAESCTGGLLGGALTEVSGSSAWYLGGVTSYSNGLKRALLGVPDEVLERHGAVSAETAAAMARGALARLGGDWALSVTGIAGPDGGTPEKPVGEVWIGIAFGGDGGPRARVRRFRFRGDREVIRRRTVQTALVMLRLAAVRIGGPATVEPDPPLTWEAAGPAAEAPS